MSLMPDPIGVLISFQEALAKGMPVYPCQLSSEYKMTYDEPDLRLKSLTCPMQSSMKPKAEG